MGKFRFVKYICLFQLISVTVLPCKTKKLSILTLNKTLPIKPFLLDRSWARRARGSGPRKRPTLLGADFSAERERPNSPSPLAESKPLLPAAEEEEAKPKEWRQKIESWLQANENDQANDDARRQARRLTNRRSLEMDSGK